MGISKSNLGVSVESVLNFIKSIAGTHNSIPGRDATDTHPISAITGLQDKVNLMDDINIAQKTVNTKGIKELLTEKVTVSVTVPSSNGSPVLTSINLNITLKESIKNYDFINIQIATDSGIKIKSEITTYNVSEIVYNTTNTYKDSDNSVIFPMNTIMTSTANSWGGAHIGLRGWFKSDTELYFDGVQSPFILSQINKISIISIKGIKIENTTIDPVEHVNITNGIEDCPVGHILSQMGKTAPKHYLICNGATYNIVEYPHLSQYIKDQFGTFNFFGGDGTTTFAVPDLRGEFLRGTGTATRDSGTGLEVGSHQESTSLPYMGHWAGSGVTAYTDTATRGLGATNIEKEKNNSIGVWVNTAYTLRQQSSDKNITTVFNIRPTNTAVLYCIKYEPTYFMSIQGIVEENILWEGSIGSNGAATVDVKVNLNESIVNYDKIRIHHYSMNGTSPNFSKHNDFKEIPTYDLIHLINLKESNSFISCIFGYMSSPAYTNILPAKSTYTTLSLDQNLSYVTKIVGIKYRTF